MNLDHPTSASALLKAPKGPRARPQRTVRGRGRLPADTQTRPVRARRVEPRERVDLDGLYLSEMAASTVLTAEQEGELARNIAEASRAILRELVGAPAGADALVRLGADLTSETKDIRDVLLNPDQDGLDLGAVRERVELALATAKSTDDATRARLVDTLADVRLDDEIIDGLVESLRRAAAEGGDDHATEDRAALARVHEARRELKRSKERFVIGNLRLVVLFARKYLHRGVPLLDLVQEGNLGLMRAADKFDHRRGFRFSTYAAWWIKQALQRALLDRTLRLPVHVADDRRRVGKIRASFQAQHRREATAEELAGLSGLAKERIDNILSLPAQPASLDVPLGEDGDANLGDLVPSTVTPPDQEVALHALGAQLSEMLDALTSREQQVVRMRFGLGGDSREYTLEEVGRALGLTRERIRQIERGALDKLRARSERVQLHTYLEL